MFIRKKEGGEALKCNGGFFIRIWHINKNIKLGTICKDRRNYVRYIIYKFKYANCLHLSSYIHEFSTAIFKYIRKRKIYFPLNRKAKENKRKKLHFLFAATHSSKTSTVDIHKTIFLKKMYNFFGLMCECVFVCGLN